MVEVMAAAVVVAGAGVWWRRGRAAGAVTLGVLLLAAVVGLVLTGVDRATFGDVATGLLAGLPVLIAVAAGQNRREPRALSGDLASSA